MIGLDVVGLISGLFRKGVASGVFRSFDPDRAITLIGQQIYGAMSVRAADPLPRARERGRHRDLRLHAARFESLTGLSLLRDL